MQREISEMVDGREIDSKTPMGLSPLFRNRVTKEALLQYES